MTVNYRKENVLHVSNEILHLFPNYVYLDATYKHANRLILINCEIPVVLRKTIRVRHGSPKMINSSDLHCCQSTSFLNSASFQRDLRFVSIFARVLRVLLSRIAVPSAAKAFPLSPVSA
jgi:hypothetical protein